MKIAILVLNKPGFEYSFSALATELFNHGHTPHAFYAGEEPPDNFSIGHSNCSWFSFDLDPIRVFNPDRVLIFNGSHDWSHAAMKYIEKKWKTFYMEHAWLPQAGNDYIDTKGTGARSSILESPLPTPSLIDISETMAKLQELYAPVAHELTLPANYILVPLQSERDTSIVYDSPYFKTMPSFISFVIKHFPDYPIVVKKHPTDATPWEFKGVTLVTGAIPMKDLLPGAKAVVGINSTSLIEALVQYAPIATLGYNVASKNGVFVEPEVALENVRSVLDWAPPKDRVKEVLTALANKQYPTRQIPSRIIKLLTT